MNIPIEIQAPLIAALVLGPPGALYGVWKAIIHDNEQKLEKLRTELQGKLTDQATVTANVKTLLAEFKGDIKEMLHQFEIKLVTTQHALGILPKDKQ